MEICINIAPVDGGIEDNDVFKVDTQKNSYILKLFKKQKLEELRFEAHILQYLNNFDGYIHVVSDIHDFEDKLFLIYEFFEGSPLAYEDIKLDTLRQVALLQAHMHKVLLGKEFRGSRERFPIFDLSFVNEFTKECRDEKVLDLINTAEAKLDQLRIIFKNSDLPTSVIHEDLEMVNILKSKKGQYCFIDFGESHIAPIISDISTVIKEIIINPKGISKDLIKEYLHAYQKNNPLLDQHQLDMVYYLVLRRTLFMATYLLFKGDDSTVEYPKEQYSCNLRLELQRLYELTYIKGINLDFQKEIKN